MSFSAMFLGEVRKVAEGIDSERVEKAVDLLAKVREDGGRLFVLGVGGSAANASHAVNDFRKITGIEAYAPTDNVAELTARTNDEGWPTVFAEWLRGSRLNRKDALLVLSVGGGDLEKNVSANLVEAMQLARKREAKIIAIVGRDGGYAAKAADAPILIPVVHPERITPHTEAFQAVVWHLMVSHPRLKQAETKWESVSGRAVFLDRDGTLNRLVGGRPPWSLGELDIYGDADAALMALKGKGFKLIVVTNQPDIGRGKLEQKVADSINIGLARKLPVDDIRVCPHSDEHGCGCRKPRPGMIQQAAADHGIDLKRSYVVGDSWKDINAGLAAGCKTVWLVHAGEKGLTLDRMPDTTVASLAEAAAWILEDSK